MPSWRIIQADVREGLRGLADESAQCVVTSPPYWGLRDYGVEGQLGLEPTPELYVERMVEVFRDVRRVLRNDGVLWLNEGDCYASTTKGSGGDGVTSRLNTKYDAQGRFAEGGKLHPRRDPQRFDLGAMGLKPKDLVGLPWMVAFALRADGWYLRSCIPWLKRNATPEPTRDRPTTAVEYWFLLSKSARYFYDAEAVKIAFADERMGNPGGGGQYSVKSGRNDRGALKTGSWTKGKESSGHNRRNSDWFFESWRGLLSDEEGAPLAFVVNTGGFKGAHFATFPEKVVDPCVKAGTSEHGACAKCGAPWERIVKRTSMKVKPGPKGRVSRTQCSGTVQKTATSKTIGWRPTCKCDAGEPVPCVVLDPFAGSGTTGVVALRLGRSFVGVDINPEYCKIARSRIRAAAPLYAVEAKK